MRLRFAGLVVLAAVALGGCASADSSNSAGEPPSVAATSASAADPTSAAPVSSGSVSAATMTITGEVKDGVEPGCVLLNTGQQTYLLIGGDRTALKSGTRITVIGTLQPGLMTTCQQGTPFQVTSIKG
jgi:D-serine deaminase-like pyridoxal phosphate-dependent protein